MFLPRTFVCLLAVAHVAACTRYANPRPIASTEPLGGNERVRLTGLPGAGSVRADGAFRYRIDRNRLCEREERVKDSTVLVEHKELTGAGITAIVLGALIASSFLAAADADAGVALFGIGLGGVLIAPPVIGRTRHTTRKRLLSARTTSSGFQEVPCERSPGAVLGELEVTAPWGGKLRAGVDDEDTASFAVDWAGSGVDATSPDARAMIGGSWKIVAVESGLTAYWEPSRADVDSALALIGGGTPGQPPDIAVASFAVEGGDLVTGQSATIRLSITNRGDGTAHKLVARTRAGIPALHDVTFSFGKVAAGDTVTRSATVMVDAAEAETSTTIVVVFSEANAFHPPNHTQRFAIRPGVCPEGKLDHAQYRKKREKLRRAHEAGALTREEFDKYDAEMVNCLK